MKRFIISVLCVAVFFIGLGGLVEKTAANFKSDAKALELIKKARIAIGGEANIANVRAMTITGKATKTFEAEGIARNEQGDLEINFELPNKMSKMLKIGADNGSGNQIIDKRVDVVVVNGGEGENLKWKTEGGDTVKTEGAKKIIIKKTDGTTEEVKIEGKQPLILQKNSGEIPVITTEDGKTANVDGKQIFIRKAEAVANAPHRQNELLRTTLSLLLTAPEGLDVSYIYAGEMSVDGNSCEVVEAQSNGSSIKLYLDKFSNLPRMISFQSAKPLVFTFNKKDANTESSSEEKVFVHKMGTPETAEFQVKFSDYRSVNGLQLPFRWTQTVAGKDDESVDISNYEINPANIAEKFKDAPTRVMIKTAKPQ